MGIVRSIKVNDYQYIKPEFSVEISLEPGETIEHAKFYAYQELRRGIRALETAEIKHWVWSREIKQLTDHLKRTPEDEQARERLAHFERKLQGLENETFPEV
jgi:ribosomal protein S15P/S13E